MSAIIIENGLVHYEALGRGRPLILLHGWLGSWRYWIPTMEELSVEYRTYSFDLWGFGDSEKKESRYDIKSYVQLLDSFIEGLGINPQIKVPIVGHGLGAVIGLFWSYANPDRVDRMMAVGLPLVGNAINRKLVGKGAAVLFDKALIAPPPDFPALQLEARKADENALTRSAAEVMSQDMRQVLRQLGVWTLLVHGEKDDLVEPPYKWLDNSMKHVRMFGLPESRHFPMLDERAKFNRLLRDFLAAKSDEEWQALELKDEWRRQTR